MPKGKGMNFLRTKGTNPSLTFCVGNRRSLEIWEHANRLSGLKVKVGIKRDFSLL